MTVSDAVARELNGLPDKISESGLAAMALSLAETIDDAETRPTAKAMCSRELREALDRLRALAPPKREHDRIDEVNEKREDRRRRRAAS